MVRTNLPVLLKSNITPLIVQDIHGRDVVKILQKNKVKDVIEFDWLSQLRLRVDIGAIVTTKVEKATEQVEESNKTTDLPNADVFAYCLQTK